MIPRGFLHVKNRNFELTFLDKINRNNEYEDMVIDGDGDEVK